MSPDRIKQALGSYLEAITAMSYVPQRHLDEYAYSLSKESLEHAAWMCQQAISFVGEGRIEKACRWLGFVQGVLWCRGVRTIDEMRRDNMPEGAEFQERESDAAAD